MHPRGRFELLLALPCAACLVANPRFDGPDAPATGTGATATGGAIDHEPTATTSGAAPTTGSTGDGGDATASGGATTDEPTSTGPPAPLQAQLKHYPDLSQCDFTYWCVQDGNVNSPTNAENWAAECFDAPFAPPFTVDRVGFKVYGRRNSPPAALEFHAYDSDAHTPESPPFATVSLGAIDKAGYHEFPLDPPVDVPFQRFCITVHSGSALGSQLGLAVDDVPAPAGQTFVGMSGPTGCDIPPFRDIVDEPPASKNQWCIDATITRP